MNTDEEQPFLGYEISQGRDYSEETAARIDEDVRRLLDSRHEYVQKLLAGARDKLDQLVQDLLQEETIDQDDMIRILGPRVFAGEETMHPVEVLQPHS